jgi:hypothetical protein
MVTAAGGGGAGTGVTTGGADTHAMPVVSRTKGSAAHGRRGTHCSGIRGIRTALTWQIAHQQSLQARRAPFPFRWRGGALFRAMPSDLALSTNSPTATFELHQAQPLGDGRYLAAFLLVRSGAFVAACPYVFSHHELVAFTEAVTVLLATRAGHVRLAASDGGRCGRAGGDRSGRSPYHGQHPRPRRTGSAPAIRLRRAVGRRSLSGGRLAPHDRERNPVTQRWTLGAQARGDAPSCTRRVGQGVSLDAASW